MIATPIVLTILARNDLGEDRFYGAIETASIVLVLIVLVVAIGAYTLVLIRVPVSYTHLTLPTSTAPRLAAALDRPAMVARWLPRISEIPADLPRRPIASSSSSAGSYTHLTLPTSDLV